MKQIQLANRKGVVLVDDEGYEVLNEYRWCLLYQYTKEYAVRRATLEEQKEGYPTMIQMHRQIMGIKDSNIKVDHRNMNGLDNQRHNLRIATQSQNMANNPKKHGCTSIYKGVYWNKAGSVWVSKITLNLKSIHIGRFKLEIDAAMAYNKKAKELFGDFAQLNIIQDAR